MILSIVRCLLLLNVLQNIESQDSEDFYLSVSAIIRKYGYPVEEHFVTTDDGYILRMHRIPHGINSTPKNQAVLVMHGILCSSADWIMSGPYRGLGYLLAEAGYDVWLGNARGNTQSRNHTTLNPDKDHSFWSFSWHQIGMFDVPAKVDYILNWTNQKQVYYIGHSQGATALYVMLSQRPEYNAKIKSHFDFAPAVFLNHMTSSLIRSLAVLETPLNFVKKLLGLYELFPYDKTKAKRRRDNCADGSFTQPLCKYLILSTFGDTPKETNISLVSIVAGHTPAGSSTMQLLHFLQLVNSGKFCQYDFGLSNKGKYGSFTPPCYDLSKATSPAYVFYSKDDYVVNYRDVEQLCKVLGSYCKQKISILVNGSGFNHMNYIYGKDAPNALYKVVTDLMSVNQD